MAAQSPDPTGAVDRFDAVVRQLSDSLGQPLRYVPWSEAAEQSFQAAVPVRCIERTTGVVQVDAADGGEVGSEVLKTLEVVAGLLSEVQSLESQLADQSTEWNTLVSLGQTSPETGDVSGAVRRLLESACQLTGLQAAAFFLLDPSTRRLILRADFHRRPRAVPYPERRLNAQCPDCHVLANGHMILQLDKRPNAAAWLPADAATGIGVRVQCNAAPLGTLWAYDRRRRDVAPRTLQVLESVAAQLGAVLEREALAQQWTTSKRLRHEVGTASANATADVLRGASHLEEIDVAGFCTSRSELGGDLCELFPLDERRIGLAVGDASGHGIAAALVMAAARGALHAIAMPNRKSARNTERVMRHVNAALCRVTALHQFMSLTYGVLDTAAMSFHYTNAGHPCPLHVRGDDVTELRSHGLLAGIQTDASYSASTIRLQCGDCLVFYSDGISEAIGRRQRMVRSTGIADAVRDCPRNSAADVVAAVIRELDNSPGQIADDDRTLLVIRLR